MDLYGKRVLITGGTGSLGTALTARLLGLRECESITIFSRDEKKQHDMRLTYPDKRLQFIIGDVRSYESVSKAIYTARPDIIFHTAALKQVGACEANVREAMRTNSDGAYNIITAIQNSTHPPDTVVGISTDKGCEPVNVYGATKLLQEKLFIEASGSSDTRYINVLYGNVMGSRGSVIPVFLKQIAAGGPVTITLPGMTRFLISLDMAVDTLEAAVATALPGEIYIPANIPAARIGDIADVMINGKDIEKTIIGKRPGEKEHEVLVPEADCSRTVYRDGYYVVTLVAQDKPALDHAYVSKDHVVSTDVLRRLLKPYMEGNKNGY